MLKYHEKSNQEPKPGDLLPHQQEALLKLLSTAPPVEWLHYLRRYYDGFVYNAQGNVDLEDHYHYRELDNFFAKLSS